MRAWRYAVLGLALALLAGMACQPRPASAQTPERPRPVRLRVVLDKAYPPYVFAAPDGGFQGILIDTWKLWEHKSGIPVTLLPLEWSQAQARLLRGEADVIDMLFRTPQREKEYTFSKPYETIEVPIFIHEDLGGIHDIDTLRGFAVGVKKGDAAVEFLRDKGITPLVPLDSYEAVVEAARDGKINVFCIDKPPGLYYLSKFDQQSRYRLAFTLSSGQFHRAVRKGNEALLALVDDGFSRITPEEHAAIEKKWLGSRVFPASLSRFLPWILAGVGTAIVMLTLFNMLLRRTVRRQTARLNDLLETMARREERHRELIQSANSVIVRLTPKGILTFCNEYAQRFFGYGSDRDMVGRNFAACMGVPETSFQKDLDALLSEYSHAPTAMQNASLIREGRRCNGEQVWLAWSLRALHDTVGRIVEVLGVGIDITERKRTEEALRASEERYALVAKGSNDGIWDWELRTNTAYFSPRYLEILGYAPDELPMSIEEWNKRIHPDDVATVIRENQRCAKGEVDHFSIEYRMLHKDGTYHWIHGRGTSLRDAEGRVTRMAGTHTDITRRKRAEVSLRESQDQLATIFRFTPVGIVIISRRDKRIMDVNEAGAAMFGYGKADMPGHTAVELGLWRHLEDQDALLADMQRHGNVVGRELEMRHKKGFTLVTLCSAVFNQAYGEACILAVLVDITERKAIEQALRRSKETAEAANRAKTEFLSTMSHEIRTPMNTILGMVDVLADTPLNDRQTRAIHSIEIAGANLLGLLSNILDLSQIESGGLIMEERDCDPAELVTKVVDMLRPDAMRKGLVLRQEIAPDLPSLIRCCPDRIRQILVNLVGNALKFTDQGEIVVSLRREDTDEPQFLMDVRDTGIGIPIDKQSLIFDRFTQVNTNTSRKFGGVGLGLTICKRLVDMMGGQLHVESREGHGSTFTVRLPLRSVESDDRPASSAPFGAQPQSHSRPGMVLLVEDSSTNAEVLRLMLENAPFKLIWAPSGRAALEVFRKTDFDIVLMDVEMPDMDGYQTTEALRRLETELGRSHTPIIALTAHAFEEHQLHSQAAGCDDFQIKPIPKTKLLDILHTWMAVRPR